MGRRFGESDLRAARWMCSGKPDYRGFSEDTCARRMHRQVQAGSDVTDPSVFPNAFELALYYANQWGKSMLFLENQTWYILSCRCINIGKVVGGSGCKHWVRLRRNTLCDLPSAPERDRSANTQLRGYSRSEYPLGARMVGLCRLNIVMYVGVGCHGAMQELLGLDEEEGTPWQI